MTLDGRDLRGRPPHARAALGLARTWQSGDLFDDLLVEENLAVAQDRSPAWRIAFRDARRPAGDRETRSRCSSLAGPQRPARPTCPRATGSWSASPARSPPGRACCCSTSPAAGLDTTESQALGAHLRAIADRGQSTLLIDHDMGLVLSICDRVVVLEFGELIADGAPEIVRRDPRVVAAYLGGAEVELAAAAPRVEEPRPEGAIGG